MYLNCVRQKQDTNSSPTQPSNHLPFRKTKTMTSRQGASRSTTTSGVRRNLFAHTLNRRAAAPSASLTTTSTAVQVAAEHDGASDIVARDEHGNYQLDQPALAPLPRDELQDERGMFLLFMDDSSFQAPIPRVEVSNRLIETYGKRHHQHIEPSGTRFFLFCLFVLYYRFVQPFRLLRRG